MTFRFGGTAQSGRLVAESVHATGASVVAAFDSGLQTGAPALTRHRFGAGEAWYVATQPVGNSPSTGEPGPDALDAVVAAVVEASGVRPVVEGLPAGVEAARRGDLVTLINHGDARVEIAIDVHGCRDRPRRRARGARRTGRRLRDRTRRCPAHPRHARRRTLGARVRAELLTPTPLRDWRHPCPHPVCSRQPP